MTGENLIDSKLFDFGDIPGADSWIRLCEIDGDDSDDRKFYVKNKDRQRFFLRSSEPGSYGRVKTLCEHLEAIGRQDVPVPSPAGFGVFNHGRTVYSHFSHPCPEPVTNFEP